MKEQMLLPSTAAEWFLALNTSQEPPADILQAWLRWFESSEDNRRAFEEISQVWHDTPSAMIARPIAPSSADDYDGAISVEQWRAQHKSKARRAKREALGSPKRRTYVWMAAAASVCAVVVATFQYLNPATVANGRFATHMGEHRDLVLADGSRVTLGGASHLTVDLNSNMRVLRLDAGEAYFKVHKDPQRPFVVFAKSGSITAVGTAFNIRAVADRVTVTVTDGAVRLAETMPKEQTAPKLPVQGTPTLRLSRGEQISYRSEDIEPALITAAIDRVDADQSARWQKGWLVYRDEPLKYVIADISRYSDIKLTVTDAAQDLKFSGAVFKDDIAEWIVALPEVSPVMVSEHGGGFIVSPK